LRMLSEHVQSLASDDDDAAPDPLAMLHATAAGQRELGYLRDAHEWASRGTLEYSRELDEATRYGCGVFNRVWKHSALRDEFLATYERFVAEVVAPSLGSAHALVYQAVPVFRVFLPAHLAVGPRHTDAQYHEQPNEINVRAAERTRTRSAPLDDSRLL
jgi:hypothetical protein